MQRDQWLGAIAAIGYLAAIGVYERMHPGHGPALPRESWMQRRAAIVDVWPVAAIFLAVFGGIYGGIFTPTEGAGVGAVGTFIAGLMKRELNAEIRES